MPARKPSTVKDVALRLLARREHAVGELQQKLIGRGYASDDVASTLQHLQEQNLLSDQRFTEAYVHYRVQRGDGPLKLHRELELRGVSAEMIEQEFARVDWSAALQQYWQRRYSTAAKDYREWTRQARHLQSRGFGSDLIRRFIPAVKAADTEHD